MTVGTVVLPLFYSFTSNFLFATLLHSFIYKFETGIEDFIMNYLKKLGLNIPWHILCILLTLALCRCGHSHENEEAHEDEDHHHHGVEMDSLKAKEFGIETEIVAPASFSDVIKTTGTIESSNSDLLTATAKKSGIITLTPGLTEGALIRNGAKIGSISTAGVQGGDIPQAANANLSSLKAEYERLKPLFEEGLVTAATFHEAERAYKEAQAYAGTSTQAGSALVASPADGTLTSLLVKSGDYVEVGAPVASIAKNTTQILKADLPSRLARHLGEIATANFIPEGGETTLRLIDFNGRKISGNSATGASNGYIPIYFSFSGNPLTSPPGFAEVFLICGQREGVISVPRGALTEIQGNKYVYVAVDDDAFEKKLVKTGSSDGERVEIIEGLEPGEKVVTKGASIIRMVEVSAVAPPSHTHNH